jgi:hypothetical protein
MLTQTLIVSTLASFGISNVAFHAIGSTTAIRITDQPYRDHKVADMIARDILVPMGVSLSGFASNALFDTDDRTGMVVFTSTEIN